MKITKLELTNYRCFDNLVLDNLGRRVVLVGPNGSGKSAILQSIAALKELISTYHTERTTYQRHMQNVGSTVFWPNGQSPPIRSGQDEAKVAATFVFEGKELEFTKQKSQAEVGITIKRTGQISEWGEIDVVHDLFGHFDPTSGAGVIDYISPLRTFPTQRIQSLELARIDNQKQRLERIELPGVPHAGSKFSATKMFLVNEHIKELAKMNKLALQGASVDFGSALQTLKSLFFQCFAPKQLVGYSDDNDEMNVLIATPFGEHDFDQLSSGEKELFSIIINLYRIRNLPSVILYDEPERHLNAGLENKIIPAIDQLQSKNQIWIATHGLELIGSVPLSEIIALGREPGPVRVQRYTEESKTKRIRLFEELGAKVGLQLVSNLVVFLEGKESHADKRILERLIGPILPGVLFVASGPSKAVMGAGSRAGLVAQEASKDAAFLMVLDRDYRGKASIATLVAKLNNRAYVWGCHEVENLLLEPEAILGVLKNSGVEVFSTAEEVTKALHAIAESSAELFTCQWAAYKLYQEPTIDDTDDSTEDLKPTSEENVRKMAEGSLKRSQSAYSPSAVENALTEAKKEVKFSLGTRTWAKLLPGKEILESFRVRYLAGVASEQFKEQIMSEILRKGKLPEELVKLVEFIKSH